MKERPTSITVISWILIVSGGLALIMNIVNLYNPMAQEMAQKLMAKSLIPVNIQYIITYAGLLITLVCGIAMLKGKNWARLLYVGWSVAGFLIAMVASPLKAFLIPGIIFFSIIAFFLFRPKANEYFKATEAA